MLVIERSLSLLFSFERSEMFLVLHKRSNIFSFSLSCVLFSYTSLFRHIILLLSRRQLIKINEFENKEKKKSTDVYIDSQSLRWKRCKLTLLLSSSEMKLTR